MNFEESFKAFEDIIKQLEKQDLSLSEGVSLFEKGVMLLKQCYSSLGEASGKISILSKELDEIVLKPFNLNDDKK